MAADLLSEVNRARFLLGKGPLVAAFHMSPEELKAKADAQTRDSEGKFVDEADVKAELPEGMEPVDITAPAPEEAAAAPPPAEPAEVAEAPTLTPRVGQPTPALQANPWWTDTETITAGEVQVDDIIDHNGLAVFVDGIETIGEGDEAITRVVGTESSGRIAGMLTFDLPIQQLVTRIHDEDVESGEKGPAPLPETEWRASYDAARAKLPENMADFGKVDKGQKELRQERENLERLKEARDAIQAGTHTEADLAEVGKGYSADYMETIKQMSPEELRWLVDETMADLEEEVANLERSSGRPSFASDLVMDTVEVDGHTVPGPTVEAHLAAVLEVGAALDGELDRRIQNRLRSMNDEQLAAVIEDAKARADAAAVEVERLAAERAEAERDAQENAMWEEWDRLVAEGADVGELTAPPSVEELLAMTPSEVIKQPGGRAILDMRMAMNRAVLNSHEVQDKRMAHHRATQEHERLSSSADISTESIDTESLAYGVIQQQEAVGLLSEIRAMGGEADIPINESGSTRETISTAVNSALATLPADWVADLDNMMLTVGTSQRGYFQQQRHGSSQVMLSNSDRKTLHAPMQRVAVHELSHAVESQRPHIKAMEWALSHHRSPRDEEELVPIYKPKEGEPPELAFADQWWNAYTGKQYREGTHDTSWEILTTGIESLMASSPYFWSEITESGLDNQFRAFILALLADA